MEDGIAFDSWKYLQEYSDDKKPYYEDVEKNDYALVKLVDKIPKSVYLRPTVYCHKCLLDKYNKK